MTEQQHPQHLAAKFPCPSQLVVNALDELQVIAAVPRDSTAEPARIAELARPWDPACCPPDLQGPLYRWLDEVAGWINEEHTWRVDHRIPNCWPAHPHIVHELAAIACLRWHTTYTATPAALEDWHRTSLPMFLERINQRIGTTGCPPGRHQPNPGISRNVLYRERAAATAPRARTA